MQVTTKNIKNNALSLYIHIPFCKRICSYCDFPKVFYDQNYINLYLESLFNELDNLPNEPIKTIYIGGGTPLALNFESLKTLLNKLNDLFDLKQLKEFTIETTAEEINEEKIKLLKSYNVNRLSIGVQTFLNLPYLNRKEDFNNIKEKADILIRLQFKNYNFDLIYGWPNETINDFKNDLKLIMSLNPTHISLYPLAIEGNTILSYKKISPIEDDEYAKFYDFGVQTLKQYGYNRYEISNFSKPGYESIHNLSYWKGEDYLACGLGATSFYKNHRIKRTFSLSKYNNKDYIAIDDFENVEEMKNDYVMLNLRLSLGFELKDYEDKFNSNFLIDYKENIDKVRSYLDISDKRIKVKNNLLYILDSILVDLLK